MAGVGGIGGKNWWNKKSPHPSPRPFFYFVCDKLPYPGPFTEGREIECKKKEQPVGVALLEVCEFRSGVGVR